MIVKECFDLVAEWAGFILVEDDVAGETVGGEGLLGESGFCGER